VNKPTHRETCRAIASQLLREEWADAACWEVAFGGHQLDVIAVSATASAEKESVRMATWESRAGWARSRNRPEPERPSRILPRVAVVEVKVSRSDLQAGLRRGQLREYASDPKIQGTHFSLALWDEVLVRAPGSQGWWRTQDQEAALADLSALGVPDGWGVIRVSRSKGRDQTLYVEVLRRAARLRPAPDLGHRLGLVETMARSLAYRVLSPTSPERESA
jgi:hypothetical protein